MLAVPHTEPLDERQASILKSRATCRLRGGTRGADRFARKPSGQGPRLPACAAGKLHPRTRGETAGRHPLTPSLSPGSGRRQLKAAASLPLPWGRAARGEELEAVEAHRRASHPAFRAASAYRCDGRAARCAAGAVPLAAKSCIASPAPKGRSALRPNGGAAGTPTKPLRPAITTASKARRACASGFSARAFMAASGCPAGICTGCSHEPDCHAQSPAMPSCKRRRISPSWKEARTRMS